MNIDFDDVRMLRDDYVEALNAENAALAAVSAYLSDGGRDPTELASLQAKVRKAYEETARAGNAWNDRIAQALPKDE